MTTPTPSEARQVALLDEAFEAEIARVSHVPYDSHEICRTFYGHLRARYAEATRALRQGGEAWQPIATAPRDGTAIFAFWANDTAPDERSYGVTLYEAGGWINPDNYLDSYGEPTHWQPLPTPPAQEHPND